MTFQECKTLFLENRLVRTLNIGLAASAALFIGLAPTEGGSFTIEEWVLGTQVEDFASGGSDIDGTAIVQNPFHATHFASVGVCTAETQYNFAWSDTLASFLLAASHEAEDIDSSSLFSRSAGSIIFTTSQDVFLTFRANYDYVAPATGFFTRLMLNISQEDVGLLFAANEGGGPWVLEPAVGTLTIEEQTLLLAAGARYTISYELSTTSFASGTGIIATADGEISLTLQTVPEPATLSLLTLGSLLLLRQRRCH